MPVEIQYSMNKNTRFSANLAISYKPWKHVLLLVGILWAVFFVVFAVDWGINGAETSTAAMWKLMQSLLYLSVVFSAAAAFYFAAVPVQAWLSSLKKMQDAPWTATFAEQRVYATDAAGDTVAYDWQDLREWRTTASFWILRDRSKKGKAGHLVIPRAAQTRDSSDGAPTDGTQTRGGITSEEMEKIRAYRAEFIRRAELKKNPVAAERERQAKERAARAAAREARQRRETEKNIAEASEEDGGRNGEQQR